MSENQIRTKRETESREAFARPKQWMPPQSLPDPHPEPGYDFRWIRIALQSKTDDANISSKLQEGWEPVKASDHPELKIYGNDSYARFPDSVISGGLLLCKTPVEFTAKRNEHYRVKADTQMQSVDNAYMRESDPRMPLFKERKSTVTFGSGSR